MASKYDGKVLPRSGGPSAPCSFQIEVKIIRLPKEAGALPDRLLQMSLVEELEVLLDFFVLQQSG